MAVASIEVGYRPLRVGMLVREGELGDVVEAARLSTLVWGGYFNPIIPVTDDPPPAERLAADFQVDVLHPVVADERIDEVVGRLPHLRLRLSSSGFRDLFAPIADDELGLVDVRLLISHYFQTIVQHGGGADRAALPTWSDDDELAALYTIVFGDYAPSSPGPGYRTAFEKGLAANTSYRLGAGPVPTSLFNLVTPIELTADSLWRPRPRWRRDDGVFLGDPRSSEDLASFWNLRASGLAVTFWPLPDGATMAEYALEHLKSVMPRASEATERFGPYFWRRDAWSKPPIDSLPAPLAEAVEQAGTRPLFTHLDGDGWRGVEPLEATSRSVLATVEEQRWGRHQMTVGLPQNPYPNARFESFHELWVVTLSALTEYEYPGYTVKLPALPDLNGWASEILTGLGDVRLTSGPVGIVTRQNATNIKAFLVEEAEVVRRVFARAGFDLSRSSAGEATARIIRQMEGLSGCRLFRLPGVRSLLARSTRAFTRKDVVSTIIDRGSINRYRNIDEGAEGVLQRLLDRGVFQAGLHIQCPACKVRSRFVPEALATELRCPRCATRFPLAPNLESANWKYEASGFFAHHTEHGAIPTILAMLRLENDFSLDGLVLIESHVISDGAAFNCESDFIGLMPTRSPEGLAAVVAECKGGLQEISRENVEKLTQVAERVRSSGVRTYVVLATTREAFTETELAVFREFADRGWRGRLILLTWFDLRSFDHYDSGLDALAPVDHVMSLDDLASNAEALYLDDPPAIARYIDDVGESLYI